MKIGVFSGFTGDVAPDLIAAIGQVAEDRGFHSLWVPEHVLLFQDYGSRYPYSSDGKLPFGGSGLLDPFTALTFLAAHTKRIRLGTGICIVPQRNPVYTAKSVADLDFLSAGRVDFGVGVGWLQEEFQALGVSFERRGARTDDYLRTMKTLWCDDPPRYEGEFHSIPPCLFGPRPVQRPHPPIYVGGHSRPAFRRVAEFGQGWYGHNLAPADLPPLLTALDEQLSARGRDQREVQRIVSPFFRQVTTGTLARFRELGVDQVLLPLVGASIDDVQRRGDALVELTRKVD